MLVLLPPSETKRSGGEAVPLDWNTLAFATLTPARRRLARALVSLCRHPDAAMTALKLGRTQSAEIGRNRALFESETMPAIDRYTGVVYDAVDSESLSAAERLFAHEHVAIHSALLGPVAALDAIPAYRLSHDSRLPDLSLKKHWAIPVSAVLNTSTGLFLDLRSEAYVALGAAPSRTDSVFLRVVTDVDGSTRALNHFNKKAKGQFVRALLQHGHDLSGVDDLMRWAASARIVLRRGSAAGEIELVVDASGPAPDFTIFSRHDVRAPA